MLCVLIWLTATLESQQHYIDMLEIYNKDKDKLNWILFGIANIVSSLDYIEAHKVPAYMVSLDMFKAYDRVLRDYMEKVMVAMKFPDLFI